MEGLKDALLDVFRNSLEIDITGVRENLMGIQFEFRLRHSNMQGARLFTKEELTHILTDEGFEKVCHMIDNTMKMDRGFVGPNWTELDRMWEEE